MSDLARPPAPWRERLDQALARKRVPLGFLFGLAVVWLAEPTERSIAIGGAIAAIGEVFRIWASGHLEKGQEVTCSGPYRLMRHPLYMGSAAIAAGAAVAAARWSVALLVAAYFVPSIWSAIRHEEAGMRAKFGDEYDAFPASRGALVNRPFSLSRALKNKEYRAIAGLAVVAAVFAFKAARHL